MITQLRTLQARRERDGEEGFTLIELLIVIVVLGILAAVVVLALQSVTGNAKAAACNADAKTIETAVAAFDANPPTTCTGAGCSIGLETGITFGSPATYSSGLQAATLLNSSTAGLNAWPSTSNGYSMSLATSDSYYVDGASTTHTTAKAGQVIVWIPFDASPLATPPVYGQVYDDETSSSACNSL